MNSASLITRPNYLIIFTLLTLQLFTIGCSEDDPIEPTISSIEPIQGEKYTLVEITGADWPFTEIGELKVLFNGIESTSITYSDNQITATVPRKAGTGPITIEFGDQVVIGDTFSYLIGDVALPFSGNVCDIYGPNTASPGDQLVYEHESNNENETFTWEVISGDMQIISGAGTEFVGVEFGSEFDGGSLSVTGTSDIECGNVLDISLE
ncbi:MAG: IPT/TIG domain-containing protein [Reichenbachiella sp.]|uniref:IPT/TIG domain-containing protein n=1 Tax=Reichenbachiella sp. TaxID=2184521 RepID=UPI0032670082